MSVPTFKEQVEEVFGPHGHETAVTAIALRLVQSFLRSLLVQPSRGEVLQSSIREVRILEDVVIYNYILDSRESDVQVRPAFYTALCMEGEKRLLSPPKSSR